MPVSSIGTENCLVQQGRTPVNFNSSRPFEWLESIVTEMLLGRTNQSINIGGTLPPPQHTKELLLLISRKLPIMLLEHYEKDKTELYVEHKSH